jgi:hypothetical protein
VKGNARREQTRNLLAVSPPLKFNAKLPRRPSPVRMVGAPDHGHRQPRGGLGVARRSPRPHTRLSNGLTFLPATRLDLRQALAPSCVWPRPHRRRRLRSRWLHLPARPFVVLDGATTLARVRIDGDRVQQLIAAVRQTPDICGVRKMTLLKSSTPGQSPVTPSTDRNHRFSNNACQNRQLGCGVGGGDRRSNR